MSMLSLAFVAFGLAISTIPTTVALALLEPEYFNKTPNLAKRFPELNRTTIACSF
jgi:hypothetical protein